MKLLVMTLTLTAAILAQSATPVEVPQHSRLERVGPVAIPTSDTDLIATTRYIVSMTISNHTGADVTCKVLDKQGTPLGLFGRTAAGSTVTNGTSQRWEWTRGTSPYPMLGGVTWSCSASGVVAHIVWEY